MVSPPSSCDDSRDRCDEKPTNRQVRKPWLKSLLIVVSTIILLHLLTLVVLLKMIDLSSAKAPLARLDSLAEDLEQTPGVGFDLTPSYGTAVVRHHNGSVTNVGKVTVDPEYEEMMKRLSIGGRVFHDPYANYCTPEGLGDRFSWSSLKKAIRRFLSLPSTGDVGRLVKVIRSLREVTEGHLGHPIRGVVVTAPSFPALCNNDVEEATKYIGLNPLNPYRHPYQPHGIATAYARHGFGLCENNTSIETCNAEENRLPYQQTLAVSYTNTAFIATLWRMTSAFIPQDLPESQYVADYELGSHSHLKREWNSYWDRVQLHIKELILKDVTRKPIDKVLLLGESGLDPNLLQELDDAISQHQDDMPEFHGEDPLYDAARGAAEFAKRSQKDQALRNAETLSIGSDFEL